MSWSVSSLELAYKENSINYKIQHKQGKLSVIMVNLNN